MKANERISRLLHAADDLEANADRLLALWDGTETTPPGHAAPSIDQIDNKIVEHYEYAHKLRIFAARLQERERRTGELAQERAAGPGLRSDQVADAELAIAAATAGVRG